MKLSVFNGWPNKNSPNMISEIKCLRRMRRMKFNAQEKRRKTQILNLLPKEHGMVKKTSHATVHLRTGSLLMFFRQKLYQAHATVRLNTKSRIPGPNIKKINFISQFVNKSEKGTCQNMVTDFSQRPDYSTLAWKTCQELAKSCNCAGKKTQQKTYKVCLWCF